MCIHTNSHAQTYRQTYIHMHALPINTQYRCRYTHVHKHTCEHNLHRVITEAESTMLQIHEVFELQQVLKSFYLDSSLLVTSVDHICRDT